MLAQLFGYLIGVVTLVILVVVGGIRFIPDMNRYLKIRKM
jgi:hypothetical protein